jgi:hypothetical protein
MKIFRGIIVLISAFTVFYGCKDNTTAPDIKSSNISLVNTYNTNASTGGIFLMPVGGRNYAFLADGSNGMQVIDVTLVNNIDSVSSVDTDGSAVDVFAAVVNSRRYAFVSDYSGGLDVIDVTDPALPYFMGEITSAGMFVITTYADALNRRLYVGTGSGQMQIYDLSPLPNMPVLISSFSVSSDNVNGLFLSGSILFAACGNTGLAIFDVSDPSTPQLRSVTNTSGVATDVIVNSNIAYLADSYNGTLIFNVTDPSAPSSVSRISPNGQVLGLAQNNNSLYLADNTYGVESINVSNASSPTQTGYIQTNSSAINIIYFGGYLFLAAAEGGMAIFQPTY